ncbi:MAG: TolC family protein [Bacteroidota bacterium]|nr:TolC family protein [Bacteroidota bacterium]
MKKYVLTAFSFFLSLVLNIVSAQNLDYFLQKGLEKSPALKELSNQIRASRIDSIITRSEYLPQVNFNASMMYAPIIDGYGYSEPITNGQTLTGTLNVSQQIFNKKTRQNNLDKYGIENRSLVNTQSITRQELQKAITSIYLAAYSAWLDKDYQEKMLKTMTDEGKILQQWVEKGVYRQTDYLSFKIEISATERQIKNLDIEYRKELSNLKLLCGITDTASVTLTLPKLTEVKARPVESSPLYHRFVIDSLRIQNEKIGIEQKYKPAVNWFSDAGLVNNEPGYIYQNFGISFGLGLTLPVYDGQQKKLNFDKLKTSEETRKSYQDFFLAQYNIQIRQLQSELNDVRQLTLETENQIRMMEDLISQDKSLLNSGNLQITDYILAIKNLIETRHNYTLNLIREQYLINEINFWKQ